MAIRPSGATTKFANKNSPFDLIDVNHSVASLTRIAVRQEPNPPGYHTSRLKPHTSSLQIPIEEVPIGARVPTKNPKPWEYDDSLPDPVQETWSLIKLTIERNAGGVVDAEIIRPTTWIESLGIQSGSLLPLNIPELDVSGTAFVTSVEECPSIASGEGSVVTARFLTREVHVIVRAEVLGPDGSIELVKGTTVHPIWSKDRQDFIPLAELLPGETLRAADGPAMVLSLVVLNKAVPVYNVEVHGEHVYQVGTFGIHVHNSTPCSPNVAAQVLNEAAPMVRSSLNRTLEATIGALKKLGTSLVSAIESKENMLFPKHALDRVLQAVDDTSNWMDCSQLTRNPFAYEKVCEWLFANGGYCSLVLRTSPFRGDYFAPDWFARLSNSLAEEPKHSEFVVEHWLGTNVCYVLDGKTEKGNTKVCFYSVDENFHRILKRVGSLDSWRPYLPDDFAGYDSNYEITCYVNTHEHEFYVRRGSALFDELAHI